MKCSKGECDEAAFCAVFMGDSGSPKAITPCKTHTVETLELFFEQGLWCEVRSITDSDLRILAPHLTTE